MLRAIFLLISFLLVWNLHRVNGQEPGLTLATTQSGLKYEVYLPKTWTGAESLPLLVYFEDASDTASFLVDGKRRSLMEIVHESEKEFITIRPIFTSDHPFSPEHVFSILKEISPLYRWNSKQTYLVGIFEGNKMLINTLLKNKEPFAAAAMISPRKLEADFSYLQGYPLLFVHGEMDEYLSLGQAWKLKDVLLAANIDLVYSVVPYGMEDIYLKVLSSKPIYNWLLSYPKEEGQ